MFSGTASSAEVLKEYPYLAKIPFFIDHLKLLFPENKYADENTGTEMMRKLKRFLAGKTNVPEIFKTMSFLEQLLHLVAGYFKEDTAALVRQVSIVSYFYRLSSD